MSRKSSGISVARGSGVVGALIYQGHNGEEIIPLNQEESVSVRPLRSYGKGDRVFQISPRILLLRASGTGGAERQKWRWAWWLLQGFRLFDPAGPRKDQSRVYQREADQWTCLHSDGELVKRFGSEVLAHTRRGLPSDEAGLRRRGDLYNDEREKKQESFLVSKKEVSHAYAAVSVGWWWVVPDMLHPTWKWLVFRVWTIKWLPNRPIEVFNPIGLIVSQGPLMFCFAEGHPRVAHLARRWTPEATQVCGTVTGFKSK